MMSVCVVPWSRSWATPCSSAATMYRASSHAAVALSVIEGFLSPGGTPHLRAAMSRPGDAGRAARVSAQKEDQNTLDQVARTVASDIPGTTLKRGMEIANVIHSAGRAIVYSGYQEAAEHYWEQLKGAGLTMAPLEQG